MIKEIELHNFKCFERLRLPLGQLTLLTGQNASGKSSVVQALLLLKQTMVEHEHTRMLQLNGSFLRLGTVLDVVDKINGRKSIDFIVRDENGTIGWNFLGERPDMSMSVSRLEINGLEQDVSVPFRFLMPAPQGQKSNLIRTIRGATYISAERAGPREVYDLSDPQASDFVSPDGSNAISVLHGGRDEPVPSPLLIPEAPNNRLRQVEQWMNVFFPGCGIVVDRVPRTNLITLGLRSSSGTDFHRPVNIGFGLTQLLPILIAALSAKAGDLLIIENPEVHLHPAGQSQVGQFLGRVSSSGIQVIVETHSDHVLNGVRRAVRLGMISPDQTMTHFFGPRGGFRAQVTTPLIDHMGNFDNWPAGFFDQFDDDLEFFAGWGDANGVDTQ